MPLFSDFNVTQAGDSGDKTSSGSLSWASPGVDLSFLINDSLGVSARYSAEFNGQIATQKVDGKVEWRF